MHLTPSRVLVLSPHTDDGELGCGGTISKLVENGAEVFYAAFSTAEQSVPAGLPRDILKTEVRAATAQLGIRPDNLFIYEHEVRKLNYVRQEILEQLVVLKRSVKPELVLMPALQDIHQDHSTVAQEGLRAFKDTTLFAYELIWNNVSFNTSAFVHLEERHLKAKFDALKAYRSQDGRPYMSEDFVRSLARTRGVQIGASFAEAFEVLRWIMK